MRVPICHNMLNFTLLFQLSHGKTLIIFGEPAPLHRENVAVWQKMDAMRPVSKLTTPCHLSSRAFVLNKIDFPRFP